MWLFMLTLVGTIIISFYWWENGQKEVGNLLKAIQLVRFEPRQLALESLFLASILYSATRIVKATQSFQ